VTPLGVAGAVAFALVAGYERELVYGVLIAGIGLVLVSAQATMMLPLSVELRNVRLTVADLIKQAITVVGIVALVIAGAALVPFFAVQVVVGIAILALTPLIVGRRSVMRPRFERATWRMLIVEALPVAASLALNIIYFRIVIVIASLQASELDTGLVGTSFRIFEIVLAVPTLVLGVALPVMSAAGHEDEERLRYILQRMAEAALMASLLIAILIAFTAEPLIVALGGEEYRGAAPVLRLQAFSLVSVSLALVWQGGLIAIRRQYAMAIGNGVALVAVIGLALWLIPALGPEGAAVAILAAEALLAVTVLLLLVRARPRLRPSFRFVLKVMLAAAAAALPAFVPGLPDVAAAAVAGALYSAMIYATGALPSEVKDSFRLRPPRPSA
jgi:O-antigen/teichoic acid export membrane protein